MLPGHTVHFLEASFGRTKRILIPRSEPHRCHSCWGYWGKKKNQQETTLWEEKMELEQTGRGGRLLSHSLGRGPERWGKVRPEIYSSPVGRAANAKGSMEAVLCALPGSNIVPVGSGALWPGCSVKWELWEIRDLFVLFHQAFLAAWMVPRTK